MFSRSQLVTFFLTISGGCLRVTPLSLMECLCSAPRICHKSQLISPHKCHSSLILPHQAIMPSSIMHCAPPGSYEKQKNAKIKFKPSLHEDKSSCQAHPGVILSGPAGVNLNPQSFTLIVVIYLSTLGLRQRVSSACAPSQQTFIQKK